MEEQVRSRVEFDRQLMHIRDNLNEVMMDQQELAGRLVPVLFDRIRELQDTSRTIWRALWILTMVQVLTIAVQLA